ATSQQVYRGVWFQKDGTQWLDTIDRYFKRRLGQAEFTDPEIPVRPRYLPYLLTESSDGTVWIGAPDSVRSSKPGAPDTVIDVVSNLVTVDRQGSLWIGGEDEGLWRVASPSAIVGKHLAHGAPQLEQYTTKEGLSGDRVWAIFEDREGNLWMGTDRGLDRF